MEEKYLKWGVLLSSALAIFMANIDISIVNVVLPLLVNTFHVSFNDISLINLFYLVSMTSFLLIAGKLSDLFGPELMLSAGYGIFIISSALCGLAQSLEGLEIFRFIQGIGAALLFSTSAVIITRYIASDWWGRAYGVNGLFACIGFALGSPVGGYIQDTIGWRWIFFVNIPIGIAGIVLVRLLLNKPYNRTNAETPDIVGFILSLAFIGSLSFTLHILGEPSSYPLLPLSITIVGIALAIFVFHQKRAPSPLLDFSVFKDRILNLALCASFFYTFILSGVSLLLPFYLIDLLNYSASTAGLFLAIPTASSIFLAYVSGWLTDKLGPIIPCIMGMFFCLLAGIAFHGLTMTTSGVYICFSFVLYGIGIGLFVPASVAFVMNQSEEKNRGMISSLKSLILQLGSITGLTVFTIIYTLGILTPGFSDIISQYQYLSNFHFAMLFVIISSIISLIVCVYARKISSDIIKKTKPEQT